MRLARLRRQARSRAATLALCIIDTQSVECIGIRGPRGYDAGKKVLGRMRVAMVDTDGNWLAIAVVPASGQDRDCLEALTMQASLWSSLKRAVFDGAFIAARCGTWWRRSA